MEDIVTINVGILSWMTFWITYWIFGTLISWVTHVNKIRLVTDLKDVCIVLLINMMWSLLGVILLCFIPLRAMTDSHIIIKFVFTYLITEIWFYHLHIFSHHPKLYNRLHKKHHYFQQPYAMTALYCTGYECVFINVFSVGLGCVFFQIPPPYIYIWFFVVSLNSLLSHSGLFFPYLIDGFHDKHHHCFQHNFGLSSYLDMLYGTKLPEDKEEKENKTLSSEIENIR